MAQRDAFGREAGEDSPAAMGWSRGGAAAAERRRGPGRLMMVLAVLIFGLAGGALSFLASTVDHVQGALVRVGPEPPASLLEPAALRAALARLPAGRLTSLRVAPDRIDAQVYRDGRVHAVQVTARGERTDVRTPAAVRLPRLTVHPVAPGRIARATQRPPADVSHLVLSRSGWELFLAGGRHYHADALGRHVRRAGG